MTDTAPTLSLVVLCYRSEDFAKEFTARTLKMMQDYGIESFELILVGNYFEGSGDRTPEIVRELAATDPLWAISSGAMSMAIKRSSDPLKWFEYAEEAIEGHPAADVAASLLASKVRQAEEDRNMDVARAYFAKLKDKRFAQTAIMRFSNSIDPDRPEAGG